MRIVKYQYAVLGSMDEPFTYDAINKAYREEKKTKGLAPLERNFYSCLAAYMKKISLDMERCRQTDGPDSFAYMSLKEERQRAQKRINDFLDIRIEKISNSARIEVQGAASDDKNILPEELEFKKKIVALYKDMWKLTIETESRGTPTQFPNAAEQSKCSGVRVPESPHIASSSEGTNAPVDAKQKTIPVETELVAILADIPTFSGIDRNYTLKTGDVAMIPANIARLLVNSKKARYLKSTIGRPTPLDTKK